MMMPNEPGWWACEINGCAKVVEVRRPYKTCEPAMWYVWIPGLLHTQRVYEIKRWGPQIKVPPLEDWGE